MKGWYQTKKSNAELAKEYKAKRKHEFEYREFTKGCRDFRYCGTSFVLYYTDRPVVQNLKTRQILPKEDFEALYGVTIPKHMIPWEK